MSGKEPDLLAALAALRVHDPDEVPEPVDPAAVAAWEVRLGGLARSLPPVAPPETGFAAAMARIRATTPPETGTLTVRADEGSWQEAVPGVAMKLLWSDRRRHRRGMLVRVAPGAVYPSHVHDQDEECLVLEGAIRFGELRLEAGDFHLARPGHRHPDAVSDEGCLLYIAGAM